MKARIFRFSWVFANALFILSCGVPYSMVSGKHLAPAENFVVDLPPGWRQHNLSADPLRNYTAMLEKRRKIEWDLLRLTRDGLLLQQISIGRIPLGEELPYSKRKLAADMIPLEAAEIISNDFRSNSNLTAQTIVENAPATVGGFAGFKLHYTYRTEEELNMEGLFYGAIIGSWLYYMLYEAPAQHYFAKDLEVFNRTRSSFQIVKGSSRG